MQLNPVAVLRASSLSTTKNFLRITAVSSFRFIGYYLTKPPIIVKVIKTAPVIDCTIINHFFSFFFEINLDIRKTINPIGIVSPIANVSNGVTVASIVVTSEFVISIVPIIGPVPENDDAVNTIDIITITELLNNQFDSILLGKALNNPSSQSPTLILRITNKYLTERFDEKLVKSIGVVLIRDTPIIT